MEVSFCLFQNEVLMKYVTSCLEKTSWNTVIHEFLLSKFWGICSVSGWITAVVAVMDAEAMMTATVAVVAEVIVIICNRILESCLMKWYQCFYWMKWKQWQQC